MIVIDYEIQNQLIRQVSEKPYLVNNSRNYLKLNFKFKSKDWEDLDKFIIFKITNGFDKKTKNYIEVLGNENSSSIIVPSYAIKNNFLIFTVFGENLDYRITTKEVVVVMKKTGYTNNVDIYDDDDPDINAFTYLMERIDGSLHTIEIEDNYMLLYNDKGEMLKIIPLDFLENYYDKEEIDRKFSKTIVDVDTSELAETGCLIFDKFYEE